MDTYTHFFLWKTRGKGERRDSFYLEPRLVNGHGLPMAPEIDALCRGWIMYGFLSTEHVTSATKSCVRGGAGTPAKPLCYSCSLLHVLYVSFGACLWWWPTSWASSLIPLHSANSTPTTWVLFQSLECWLLPTRWSSSMPFPPLGILILPSLSIPS